MGYQSDLIILLCTVVAQTKPQKCKTPLKMYKSPALHSPTAARGKLQRLPSARASARAFTAAGGLIRARAHGLIT